MGSTQVRNLKELKNLAKNIKKGLEITHSQALEQAARMAGFRDYHHAQKSLRP